MTQRTWPHYVSKKLSRFISKTDVLVAYAKKQPHPERLYCWLGYEKWVCLCDDDATIIYVLSRLNDVDKHLDNWLIALSSTDKYIGIVKLLLERGVDVHAHNDEALIEASHKRSIDTVKLLLEHGVNIHAQDDEALIWASAYGHVGIVKLLLEHGADIHAQDDKALRGAVFE